METNTDLHTEPTEGGGMEEIRTLIKQVIREYDSAEKDKREPAHRAELTEERRRRESLEKRVNELVEENQRSRAIAEEAERTTAIRSELQRHGVTKLDLAFRAVRDDVKRTTDGKLIASTPAGDVVQLSDYIESFVQENPEFLPARLSGGAGATGGAKGGNGGGGFTVDIEKIKPGMDRAELEKIRDEVARVALHTLGGGKR